MDVRIGITQSPKEVSVELPDDIDRAELKSSIAKALANGDEVLWLTDRKGRDVAVPGNKITYVEISSDTASKPIGFGG